MSPSPPAERAGALLSLLTSVARPDALTFLQGCWFATGAPFTRSSFAGAYAGVARRFPGAAASLPAPALDALRDAGMASPEAWAIADLARALLLLHAIAALPESDGVALATETFRRGDSAERVALLRTLPLLPAPERFTELAIEACRSHVLEVFAAIACDNPFPAAHFPELNFNQLVIKAIFMELPVSRVLDWRTRSNPELRRIATDYAAERRAAGRTVPADIAAIQSTEEPSR